MSARIRIFYQEVLPVRNLQNDTEVFFKESPFIKEYEKRLRNDASEFCISLNKIVENLCKSNADINEESEKDNISLLDRSN